MNEIEKLLQELRAIQSGSAFNPKNNKDFWKKIGEHDMDFEALGFSSKDELTMWIENNPYSALV